MLCARCSQLCALSLAVFGMCSESASERRMVHDAKGELKERGKKLVSAANYIF